MTNSMLLKSKMILCGDEKFSQSLSDLLGVSRQTATNKLCGKSSFSQHEIAVIAKRYCLTNEEIRKIFIEDDSNDDSERGCQVTWKK